MKTIKLSLSDFKGFNGRYVICDRWGVCFKTIFPTLEDAVDYYDKHCGFGSEAAKYDIREIDWYN